MGYSRFEVTADDDTPTAEFLLDLRDAVETALNEEEYGGSVSTSQDAVNFIEDIAEDTFPDFDRQDRR